ncbi:MAG: hypothetical protein J6A75_06890 [Lachnospiraceae bacterium]|nr:hypothetical protein [Lachnospiraceae bacterium]
MKIAFYGTAPDIGTSANMAVVREYLRCCWNIADIEAAILFADYSNKKAQIEEILEKFDLLVMNISASDRNVERIFLENSFIRKNVIFLFGKYNHHNENALYAFAKEYRIDRGRVCAIPYNLRFQRAHEHNKIAAYLRQKKDSFEDEIFKKNLFRIACAISNYAKKGE